MCRRLNFIFLKCIFLLSVEESVSNVDFVNLYVCLQVCVRRRWIRA